MAWRDQYGELDQLDPHEFITDPEREARIYRARGAKKAAAARWDRGPLDGILAQLVAGKDANVILDQVAERNALLDLEWRGRGVHVLTPRNIAGGPGVLCEHVQRDVNSTLAREMLRHLLQQLNQVKRHRSPGRDLLCVRGRAAFWGRQMQSLRARMSEEEIDHLHWEACWRAEQRGQPDPPRHRVWWKYVPKLNAQGKNQLGGPAGRVNKSVPTIYRWLKAWKLGDVLQSWQPRLKHGELAQDAVMPRVGKWAYSEVQVLGSLPGLLMRKLAQWWAKQRRDNPHKRPRAAGEPLELDGYDASAPATGPPQSRADAARAFDDLGRDMRLSLSDLDDLEQSCGYT